MRNRQVLCPNCGALLTAPPGCQNCIVRCGMCHCRFRLPRRIAVTEDIAANWVQEDLRRALSEDVDHTRRVTEQEVPISGRTAVLDAIRGEEDFSGTGKDIRILDLNRKGVLFQFPASRLKESSFRCAMPRRCLGCSARAHLHAHVIIFTPELLDSVSLEAEHAAGAMQVSEREARDLSQEQLIERLPRVPSAPSPGDLPMPYWLCDMCSGAGVISGQIRVHSVTGEGVCRLAMRNLRRAEEFLIAAGGEGSNSHVMLQQRIAQSTENPWDLLPDVVRHRIEQWYRPAPGERFLAYVPDRDHARTEDGMAGVLITNRRLIVHSNRRHKEATPRDSLELEFAAGQDKEILRIKAPAWEVSHIPLDRDGKLTLRRGLAKAAITARWC